MSYMNPQNTCYICNICIFHSIRSLRCLQHLTSFYHVRLTSHSQYFPPYATVDQPHHVQHSIFLRPYSVTLSFQLDITKESQNSHKMYNCPKKQICGHHRKLIFHKMNLSGRKFPKSNLWAPVEIIMSHETNLATKSTKLICEHGMKKWET